MANKTSASTLAKGLGMAMAFLQALTEEIVAAGGFEEMIHFLTTEQARPLCKQIAEFIVNLPWRIPRSLMERLAWETSTKENGSTESAPQDSLWYWKCIDLTEKFGIPVTVFHNDAHSEPHAGPIPKDILEQIVGKKASYPMTVDWNGESYVIVDGLSFCSEVGETISDNGINATLAIAPAKYFDLER